MDRPEAIRGKQFAVAEVGPWPAMSRHTFTHPTFGQVRGKVFLQKLLGLTSMEASLGVMPAGAGLPFLHRHREHEELYVIIRGRGQFQVDGETLDVREGTVLRVSPEGARTWRNNSTEDLVYMCIQAKAGSVANSGIDDGMGVPDPVRWPEGA